MSKLTLFLCLILATVAFSEILKPEEIQQILTYCAESTNTPKEEYYKDDLLLKPTSENVQCMAKCILEEVKILGCDGIINKEVISEYLEGSPEELKAKLNECVEEIKTVTECADIEKYRVCVLSVIKQLFGN